jgi:anti-sigma factor RsiW
VLLLYLADELGAEDRAEVEQRLLRDPAMGAELDALRDSQELLHKRLASLDAATPLTGEEAAAVRNVSKMMRQRLARPEPARAPQPPVAIPLLPRWAYPAAAVAAVALIAGVTWRSLNPGPRSRDVGDAASASAQDALGPWEAHVVQSLSREVGEAPLGDAYEVASIGYDQPIFDVPLEAPQEGGQAKP